MQIHTSIINCIEIDRMISEIKRGDISLGQIPGDGFTTVMRLIICTFG
jgi:hypothetical protein